MRICWPPPLVVEFFTRYCSPVQLLLCFCYSDACMTAESCSEIMRSSCATRASRVADRLSEMTTVPCITWLTSSPIRSLARACSVLVAATRLCSMISSSRSISPACAGICAAASAGVVLIKALISVLLLAQAVQLFRAAQDFGEDVFQPLVPGQLVAQVGQLGARFHQPGQGRHLAHHRLGTEVGHLAELQLHGELAALLAQMVRHAELGHRRHRAQHLVEIVGVDVDEVAVLERFFGRRRIAAEVADHADDKGQLLVFNGVANL